MGMLAVVPAALAVTPQRVLAAPPIVQPEITPQQFGATGGNAVADTLAWNRAVLEASRLGRPIVASGTYVLRAPAKSRWNWFRRPSATTHVAVQLLSHTKIFAKSCTLLLGRPEATPSSKDERHILFGTDDNVAAGSLTDIEFEGLTFDFREEFGSVHSYTYAIGVVGVDGFKRHNVTITSTGTLAGRGLLSQNTRRRTDTDIKHVNIVQGIYTRYETGVVMRQISFDGFNEALDFDGPCTDVVLDGLQFRNGYREAQCIDTGAGDRWTISNVRAERTGPIVMIYVKANGWATYREWLESGDRHTENFVVPVNWTVRNVWGRDVGGTRKSRGTVLGESLRIGTYRNEHWFKKQRGGPSPRNITIENWTLENTAPIAVNDCENLTMKNIVMSNPLTLDDKEAGAALVLREPNPAYGGKVTGSVADVTITNSRGMGVSAVAGNGLKLDNITVDGYNVGGAAQTNSGIRIRSRIGSAEKPQVGRTSVKGGKGIDLDNGSN